MATSRSLKHSQLKANNEDRPTVGPSSSKPSTSTNGDFAPNETQDFPKRSSVTNIFMACLALIAGIVTPLLWESSSEILFSSEESMTASTVSGKTIIPQHQLDIDDTFPCSQNNTLSQYLHEFPVPGLHVVCFQQNTLTMYKDAMSPPSDSESSFSKITVDATTITNWDRLRTVLVEHLQLRPTDDLHQPWATYSPLGKRYWTEVDDGSLAIDQYLEGMFLVFQGGQWIWPGVRKGFERVVALDHNKNVTLETLSLHPLVLSVEGFLTMDECDQIQTTASPAMQYSGVALMDKDKGRPASDFRTSQTTFLSSNSHQFLKSIEHKTASLVRLPVNHQEPVQVLRYGKTEKYDSHHDYFEPSLYQKDSNTLSLIQHGRRNRMITVFWYLSDVAEGGETVFPRVDKVQAPPKQIQCQTGLRVRPQAGKVIIFYSQTPDGAMDPYSLHGACPVKEGVKWAANKWVWNAPMNYVRED